MFDQKNGYKYLVAFVLSIPAANYMIGNIGTFCVPDGPCLIPVAPGLTAPSGVLMVGIALVLRDLVQKSLGMNWALGAILGGALLSGLFASPELVLASTIAFLFSELADLAVYTPLQKNRLVVAVVASGIVGLVIDSALFLYVAFGSFDYIGGQIVGKMWMILLAIPVIQYLRKREETEIDETEQQS